MSIFAKNNKKASRNYKGRLIKKDSSFAIREAFKILRTNLLYTTASTDKTPVYAITSATAMAGKSIVVANLAATYSQLGKKVLLIDGDMRCPVQKSIFGVKAREAGGLSELLVGVNEAFDDSIVKNEDYENLNILYSGRIPPNPSELLASGKMEKLLQDLRERYDAIFIDLPPVCEVADARVMANIVDSYIFVVREGISDIRSVKEGIEMLEHTGAKIAGIVYNGADLKGSYKGKYYSKYGSYSRDVNV